MIIFHFIDSLKRGGAEVLLYHVVSNLKEHNNYVITLTDEVGLTQLEMQNIKHIPLGFSSILSLPKVIYRFKRLISKFKPQIIHVHLPLATLIARIAVPNNIKLIISVHNNYSESLRKVSPRLFFLEKKLHAKREILLFVSAAIKDDYNNIIGIKGPSYVLYNFIADSFFLEDCQVLYNNYSIEKFRLVSVGSLKKQKNFEYLIKALSLLDNTKFSLDIFGEGPERTNLEKLINELHVDNIQLRGSFTNIENHLKNYDAFILASSYEGFGIAPLEAAAVGLPLILSDIQVFVEVTKGYAIYFSAHDEKDISNKILNIRNHFEPSFNRAQIFKAIVKENYSREKYMDKLLHIYISNFF